MGKCVGIARMGDIVLIVSGRFQLLKVSEAPDCSIYRASFLEENSVVQYSTQIKQNPTFWSCWLPATVILL